VWFVCEGQIYLQLVISNGTVRAYLTPEHMTVPRNEWVLLVLTCTSHKVHFCLMCALMQAIAVASY